MQGTNPLTLQYDVSLGCTGGSEPRRALHSCGDENAQLGGLWSSEQLPSGKFCSGALSTEGLSLLTSSTRTPWTDQAMPSWISTPHSTNIHRKRHRRWQHSVCSNQITPVYLGGMKANWLLAGKPGRPDRSRGYSLPSSARAGSLSPPCPAPSAPCPARPVLSPVTAHRRAEEEGRGSRARREGRTWGTRCLSEQRIPLSITWCVAAALEHMTQCNKESQKKPKKLRADLWEKQSLLKD